MEEIEIMKRFQEALDYARRQYTLPIEFEIHDEGQEEWKTKEHTVCWHLDQKLYWNDEGWAGGEGRKVASSSFRNKGIIVSIYRISEWRRVNSYYPIEEEQEYLLVVVGKTKEAQEKDIRVQVEKILEKIKKALEGVDDA